MIVQLKDVVTFHRGLTYKKADEVASSSNIVLRANNIDLDTFSLNLRELRHISDTIKIPESKKVKKDSILICTASGSKSHLAKVALIQEDLGYAFGGFMGMLLPKNTDIDMGYLFKVLTGMAFRDLVDSLTEGTNINNLKFSLIENFEFVLPSLDEQRRMVEKINSSFSKIDRAIKLSRENASNVERLYVSKYDELTHSARGESVTLDDVSEISVKLVDPRQEPYDSHFHIGAANIEQKTGKLHDLRTAKEEKLISSKFPFDEETVLYSKIRPYLMKVARPDFPGICSADIYPLTTKSGLDKDYLYYTLLSPDFTSYAIEGSQRAGMPKVNREHLFGYRFDLPSLEEQRRLVDKLDVFSRVSHTVSEKYKDKINHLKLLKMSLLEKSFSQIGVKY